MLFYSIDFRKRYKNQWILNDFVATPTILSRCAIARLNPKKAKIHWFFNDFLIFRFRAKIAHLATFGPLGGLDLVLSVSTHAVFQKSYKFPIDFVQNAIYDHLFCLQVGSKSGVIVDAKNAPGCSQTHFFAFLSIIKSIDIWCLYRGAIRAARGPIRPHLGSKSGLREGLLIIFRGRLFLSLLSSLFFSLLLSFSTIITIFCKKEGRRRREREKSSTAPRFLSFAE